MSFSAPQDSFSLRDEDDPHSPPPPFEDKVHKSPNARKQKLRLSRPFASRIWVEVQRTSVTVTLAGIGKSVTVQPVDIGLPTENGKKLSSSQAQLGQGTGLDVA